MARGNSQGLFLSPGWMWIPKPHDNPLESLQHQNMFEVEKVNYICVDWKKGSQTTYTQAANNVCAVGAQVAQTLAMLKGSDGRAAEEVTRLVSVQRCN